MRYLYRAVRKEEIDAGNILPKSQEPFRSDPIFGTDDMIFTAEGIEFGSVRNAIRHHQWQKERPYPWQKEQIPTSGVSTTPHFIGVRLRDIPCSITLLFDTSASLVILTTWF